MPDIGFKKGEVYTVLSIYHCNSFGWMVDIGLRSPNCDIICGCGCTANYIGIGLVVARAFAPIERAKIKYVVKEVEVVPAIREMEKCLS